MHEELAAVGDAEHDHGKEGKIQVFGNMMCTWCLRAVGC